MAEPTNDPSVTDEPVLPLPTDEGEVHMAEDEQFTPLNLEPLLPLPEGPALQQQELPAVAVAADEEGGAVLMRTMKRRRCTDARNRRARVGEWKSKSI